MTAIVRSLLVNIGFRVNRNEQVQANRATQGINYSLLALASSAAFAAGKVVSLFNDLSKGTLDARDLSQALGVSLVDLLAMQQAAQNFRISPDQFQGALSKVNTLFRDFLRGGRALRQIASEIGINIDPNGNAIKVFEDILGYLGKISNEQDRIEQAGKFFGENLGVAISNLSTNFESYAKSVESFRQVATTQANAVSDLEKYERGIIAINQSFQNFQITLSSYFLPAVRELLDAFTIFFTAINGLFKGIGKFFGGNGSFTDRFKDLGNSIYESLPALKYDNPILSRPTSIGGIPVPTVNSEINISVPLGTTEEQASYMSQQIKMAISDSIYEAFQSINNNSPLTE